MKNSKIKYILSIATLLLLVLLIAIGFVYKKGAAPAAVTGLKVDPCYASMNLSWDKSEGVSGYYVYMSDDGESFEKVGETDKDTCEY